MKTKSCILGIALLLMGSVSHAQTMLGKTFFTPVNIQTHEEPVSLSIGNGATFVGKKHVSTNNGQVNTVSYWGTITYSDGRRLLTPTAGYGFDENFQCHYGGAYWEISTTGEVTRISLPTNQPVSRVKETRKYTITNNCIEFPYTGSDAGINYYYGGSSLGSSSSSDSYNRHSATCMGCGGTGSCGHCGGSGMVNNYKSKCSLCHGTGRCQSCAGTGKIHGNY